MSAIVSDAEYRQLIADAEAASWETTKANDENPWTGRQLTALKLESQAWKLVRDAARKRPARGGRCLTLIH